MKKFLQALIQLILFSLGVSFMLPVFSLAGAGSSLHAQILLEDGYVAGIEEGAGIAGAIGEALEAADSEGAGCPHDEAKALEPLLCETYRLPLFTADQVLFNPINDLYYYFILPPDVKVCGPVFLELIYSHSATILPDLSLITVVLNGLPLQSRHIVQQEGTARLQWKIDFDPALLREEINELGIKTAQRSIMGLCSDLDNDANWLLLHEDSALQLKICRQNIKLGHYPYPFFDYLKPGRVNTSWRLPAEPRKEEIKALLHLASDWGRREPFQALAPFAVYSSSAPLAGGNEIMVGTSERWAGQFAVPLAAGVGVLQLLPGTEAEGTAKLLVSGSDSEGLLKAQQVLTSKEALAQVAGNELLIDRWSGAKHFPQPLGRPGSYTFAELGYPQLTVRGAFRQVTGVLLRRPLNWSIGRGSYVEIRFRHSVVLNPERSALTLYVNGRPVNSVPLNPGNAEKGVLRAEIPFEELDKTEWLIGITFYHYLGAVDCSKRYDDIAWSVVEGESFVYLTPGRTGGYPSLVHFPLLHGVEQKAEQPVIMWLSAAPDDRQLSLAAQLAARAAQNGLSPLDWHVVLGNDFNINELPDAPVIMVGYHDEKERLEYLKDVLIFWPDPSFGYRVPEEIPLLPEMVQEAAVLQAVRSPWHKGRVLYSILGSGDRSLEALQRVLAEPDLSAKLGGQLSLVSVHGLVSSFSTLEGSGEQRLGMAETVLQFFQAGGGWRVYALIIMLVLCVMGFSLWVTWKRS